MRTHPARRGFPLLLLLLIPLTLSILTGCSATEGTPSPTATATAVPPTPTPTPLPENATLGARILRRGYLRVGIRYDLIPFGYITDEGDVAGFGVDMGRELARRWLGDPQAVEFRQVRSDTAVEHLQAGDVDLVITALVHTQDLEAGADFGQPYFTDGHALLVRNADARVIDGPLALQGRTVGVVAWEQTADVLRDAVPFTLTLQTFDRFDAAVAALGRGEVNAVADLRHRLFWGLRLLPGTAIVGQFTAAPVSFAFPQDEPFFADLVRLTYQEMIADGTYASLYSRWFAPDDPPQVEIWPGDEVPALTDTPLTEEIPDTIGNIESRGYLRVAMPTDRSPFAYVDSTGTPAGYEVSLVQRMVGRWLGDIQAVQFITTTMDTGREMLRTGQVDMLLGGQAHTRAAELEQDFSLTTYIAGEGLLIWAGTPITDLHSLQGQQVAVVDGSGSGDVLLTAAREAGVSLTVLPQPTLEAAISLLEGGYAVAVAGDRADLLGPSYATPGMWVTPLRLTEVPLALGLPPGDSAFRDLVNLTLQAMKLDGEFDANYTTWFDDEPPMFEPWPGAPYRSLLLEVNAPEPAGE